MFNTFRSTLSLRLDIQVLGLSCGVYAVSANDGSAQYLNSHLAVIHELHLLIISSQGVGDFAVPAALKLRSKIAILHLKSKRKEQLLVDFDGFECSPDLSQGRPQAFRVLLRDLRNPLPRTFYLALKVDLGSRLADDNGIFPAF